MRTHGEERGTKWEERGEGARNIGRNKTGRYCTEPRAHASGENANASAAPHRIASHRIVPHELPVYFSVGGRRHKLLKSDGPILRRKIDRPRRLLSVPFSLSRDPSRVSSPARHYACENTRATDDEIKFFEPSQAEPRSRRLTRIPFNLSRVVAPDDKWRDRRNWTARRVEVGVGLRVGKCAIELHGNFLLKVSLL